MNYPFRTAILNFLRGHDDGRSLKNTVMTIAENYPPEVVLSNMNLLSTHDSVRILTALVDDFDGTRAEKAARHLSPRQLADATEKLLMASFIQYMLPGAPSLYYADEAGMEGHNDPFNRRTYPWGRENGELLAHYRNLGKLRKDCPSLRLGNIQFSFAEAGRLAFSRNYNGKCLQIYVNHSDEDWNIPAAPLLYAHNIKTVTSAHLRLAPMGFCITED